MPIKDVGLNPEVILRRVYKIGVTLFQKMRFVKKKKKKKKKKKSV